MENFAEVIVSIHHQRLDRPFTYRIPHGMAVVPGSRVVVPFGAQRLEGYCVGLTTGGETAQLKEIEELLDDIPVLTAELIELAQWGAMRWLCRRLDFLQAMIPTGVRWSTGKWVAYTGSNEGAAPMRVLAQQGAMKLTSWLKMFPEMAQAGVLRSLQRAGTLVVSSRDLRGVTQKTVRVATLTEAGVSAGPTGKKQALALNLLRERGSLPLKKLAEMGISAATVRTLADRGWVLVLEVAVRRDPLAGENLAAEPPLPLNEQQAEALHQVQEAMVGQGTQTILLHGVTGSGKTEVYLQAIAQTVKAGKGSIVLVPEIALTPQMISRFAARFGPLIAVLHSRLSAGERYDEWRRIAAGEAQVVIGARSAIFAPIQELGLIILDEEHEASYKQDETPRYHARDVALWRAARHSAAVVLGSATPSLESYRLAEIGRYKMCSLRHRISERPLPPVNVVDMRQELKEGHRSIFSRPLLAALSAVFKDSRQAILLLNRRGYATFVLCRECGHAMRCKACDVSLKYHMTEETLRCHYCEYMEKYPNVCPACGGHTIRHFGTGTQKVEEELRKFFPEIRVARMDADTTSRKGAHKKILTSFENRNEDVLIGTQMVAKGLDFPNVTLVGVITADTAINLPDFRAGERTFQLLTQVAGRAGRGPAGGHVVVQTYTPEHYAVMAAKNHDYEAFYAEESGTRQELAYPPYSVLIRLLLTGTDEAKVIDAASYLAALLEPEVDILGPSPCPLEKIRGQYRWQVVARGTDQGELKNNVSRVAEQFRASPLVGSVRVSVDVDPQSLL